MDDVTWGALAATLTLLGGLYTWFAFRRRGFVAGLRGVGITLIPAALLLTDTLQLVTTIGSAIGDWAIDFAFSPSNWLGIMLAGVKFGSTHITTHTIVLRSTSRTVREIKARHQDLEKLCDFPV